MDKETLELRIKEIEAAITQSLANHNALLGRLMEAQHVLENVKAIEGAAKVIAEEAVCELTV